MSDENEPPPFLGAWKNVYRMVIVYLAGIIALLWAVSRIWAM